MRSLVSAIGNPSRTTYFDIRRHDILTDTGQTVMLFLFNFFFAIGLLAIPWLRKWSLRAELYPSQSDESFL